VSTLSAQHHPTCYPSDPAKALTFFRLALEASAKLELPPAPKQRSLRGIVAPHIDFRFGLRSYAAAFGALLHEPLADAYIILGVGHRSRLEWNFDRRDYATPLGTAACDAGLVDALSADEASAQQFGPKAHEGEWSIEFPIVWLQALHQMRDGGRKPVRFAPLLCGGMHAYVEGMVEWDQLGEFHRISRNLAGVLQSAGEAVRVIVSIDGCHIGPRFQHPFRVTPKLLAATAAWEEILWGTVADGDVRKFLDWMRAEGNDRYFDGVGALALVLAAGNFMDAGKLGIQRTFYEQWFTERDASVVTFSSGRVLQ
jgi:AmmeMemoRadiSam system protein B